METLIIGNRIWAGFGLVLISLAPLFFIFLSGVSLFISMDYFKQKEVAAGVSAENLSGKLFTKAGALASAIIALCMILYFLPSFLEFNKIIVKEDKTWVLKNGLNITVGTVKPSEQRRTALSTLTTTFYGASIQSADSLRIQIITADKIWNSVTVEGGSEGSDLYTNKVGEYVKQLRTLSGELEDKLLVGPKQSKYEKFQPIVWGILIVSAIGFALFDKLKKP